MAVYRNPAAPATDRVEDLLARMTLEEKVAQLNATNWRASAATEEGFRDVEASLQERLAHGIGQIENTFDPRPPEESVEFVNALQRFLVEKTRLGIPALIGSECLHGHAAYGSTVFPTPLAMACSWNPDLVEKAFRIAGIEARTRGAHEAHTPVLDLGRDPRWGRIEETYGEDTHLVGQMALAAVSGMQGGCSGDPGRRHIVSSPKHFAGYGQVSGGRNFAPTPVDPKTLADEVLPPFELAVKQAGAQGMMASHCDVDGVPAHGNRRLLTGLLRDDWGFQGVVVSDYMDIQRLAEFHRVATDTHDAARLALVAGMDLDLPAGIAYQHLADVIRAQPELEEHLDRSVRCVLRLKFMLGLFEVPYVDADTAARVNGCEAHVAVAEELARESVVLLKNRDGLLPLDPDASQTIAVIGPNADSEDIGVYTVRCDHIVTILDGIRERSGTGTTVLHESGCGIGIFGRENGAVVYTAPSLSDELGSIERAVDAARQADVAVVCVGGTIDSSKEAVYAKGAKGDRSDVTLLGNQKELVMRVLATGTPTVVVLMGGKPYAIPEIADKADALLSTFYLGQTNGSALAALLFGDQAPSGKLAISFPRCVGQLPVYYSQKRTAFFKDYVEEPSAPLFPFGHGLSYTTFEISAPTLAADTFAIGEPVRFSVTVRNTGECPGKEVVQIYVRDEVGSVTRPDRLLVRFEKVFLESGEERELQFELGPTADLAFTGVDGKRTVEPGAFTLMAGPDSADLKGTPFTLVERT